MTDLRYPVGKFELKTEITGGQRKALIDSLAEAPSRLRAAIEKLSLQQLNEPYRPEGWTVRQVVHHVPDSQLNAYTRFKLGLTEVEPTTRPYDEKRWAELEDGRNADPEISLRLLESLHERWVILLRSLSPADFAQTLNHHELGVMTLDGLLQLYEWHGRHHVAQITALRQRRGW